MEENEFEVDEMTKEAIDGVMKPRVIDGEVFIAVAGIKDMVKAYADGVVEAAVQGTTCQHGVQMGGIILDNLDNLMDYCEYLNAGDLVPDTIPENLLGE
jgi:ABC-type sugar transport system substrate-binding protein